MPVPDALPPNLPMFSDLPDDDRQWLQPRLRRRILREGDVVFYKGDVNATFFVIASGRMKMCVTTRDGRETVIAILSPGDCFGELAALDSEPRSADAIAMEETVAWYLDREDFVALLERSHAFARRLISTLTRRLRATDEHLTDMIVFDVFARLALKLLELADSQGVATARGIEIPFRLTQQDLANLIGTTRESVNKALRFYRDRGYITSRRHIITIVSRSGLERRIGP